MSAEQPIWTPSLFRIADANLTRFMAFADNRGAPTSDYDAFNGWSVASPAAFWDALWEFSGVIGDRGDGPALEHGDRMPGARWFPRARLNFAENLLRGPDAEPAIIFRNERGLRREVDWMELRAEVARVPRGFAPTASARRRVAGFMPNLPETVIAMLATASLGATWSSCSPDFGIRACSTASARSRPRSLFTADGYCYAGKTIDSLASIAGVLSTAAERRARRRRALCGMSAGARATRRGASHFGDVECDRHCGLAASSVLPFDHPLYILYSSAARPACRNASCTAPAALCSSILRNIGCTRTCSRDDRLFYFTTCGWMMWNWLVSASRHRRDVAALRRLAFSSRSWRALGMASRGASDNFRHERQIHRRPGKGAYRPASP